MASNKILRLWTRMARKLDVKMLVPQHGAPIVGRQAIADFYDWLDGVNCASTWWAKACTSTPPAPLT